MHLFGDPEQTLLGVNTEATYKAVLDLALERHPQPDMICLTGDMSQDETIPAYERLGKSLLPYHCPKYWIPGNHDDIDYINKVYQHYNILNQKHMILDHWQIIMLDSKKLNAVEGYLDDDQFELMEESLGTYPEHHTLIFMHHHPVPVGSHWLDNLMLTNAERFWEFIREFKNIRAVICGHVHQEFESQTQGVAFYSTPSTCFQFKRNSARFGVEPLMPGYRTIQLFADGTLKTAVHRLETFALNLDPDLGGY
jgi:Icc protein